jgi:hypothetical protein
MVEKPSLLHPAIPRVMCPLCGINMRLTRIQPAPSRRALTEVFECTCGFIYTQTAAPERRSGSMMPNGHAPEAIDRTECARDGFCNGP